MADGSSENRAAPKLNTDTTFSAIITGLSDTKTHEKTNFHAGTVKLSFSNEQNSSESYEISDANSVVGRDRASAIASQCSQISGGNLEDGDDRKKRCLDRYDSSESSDSGVAVLSPTESSGCSGSDITEPGSPRSPESSFPGNEESASARMPPWASEPAPPPGVRRLVVQPAPVRRPNPTPSHRRITEFFNHKMKPQTGLKRDSSSVNLDDTKRKCLSKNGVTNELEKYISYLSQTLSPKVLMDVKKDTESFARKVSNLSNNKGVEAVQSSDIKKSTSTLIYNGVHNIRPNENNEKVHTTMNGFVDVRNGYHNAISKEKYNNGYLNGMTDSKKQVSEKNSLSDPSAISIVNVNHHNTGSKYNKVAIPASSEAGIRIAPSQEKTRTKKGTTKLDGAKMNGLVSSTTKLDSKMNGVTCGSNNLSLNPVTPKHAMKKEPVKKSIQTAKRTNRKSSACIANSKNLTWSKANNLKQQVQLQKQNCANLMQSSPMQNGPGEASAAPKINNIQNGVRQVPMSVNRNIGTNIGVNMTNLQNCHQINIQQPCNGAVPHNNLASFVAVPQNVMLTTLRIPPNGMPTQNINQQNNMTAFNRPNINVSGQTKLNGQIMFPFNYNGAVVQIPTTNHLVAKMPNFVLPPTAQPAHRQDQLQHQQAQILFNGTLLKLANTLNSPYSNVNKPIAPTSQSIAMMNKNVTGMQTVGMTVPSKPNYTVNLSHSVLMPQPGYIVTSVPNINVKETWCCTSTNTASSSQTSCSNPIIQHPPPIVTNFSAQTLHTSSIPIAPVKPPDNPIQGTDPPSSTVKEPEISEFFTKCDIPWLSKTVNNNIFTFEASKMSSRPFAQVGSLTEKFESFKYELGNTTELKTCKETKESSYTKDATGEELRKIEEVARREETIFTQITVLKDVSSNVQSSVIESYSSATTESSESGIGTDKSIDSPSDSQTSKECDEDSTLSLSVSVSSVEVPCQKSPILKQPKTLRFPPRNLKAIVSDKRKSSTDTTSTVVTVCMWENCKLELDSDSDLLEHLQNIHVESQVGKENFVCLWERCKVRGKPSCSRLWLERHAMSHGGNKPYKCIVDSCEKRFSTQMLLERHVNNHFNSIGQSPNNSGGKKTTDSAAKLIRRNGKKLRYRRQPWSARMFDFFDASTMEGLSWRLIRATRWRLGGACPLREPEGKHTLTLHAALTATRYNVTEARREALVTYYPPHVVEDEWVPEQDVKRIKRVEMCQLSARAKVLLFEQFSASYKKSSSPPPAAPPPAPRALPSRACASSRLLNNLLSKRKQDSDCPSTNIPMLYSEVDKTVEVSGAKKRKMGRKYGGNAFWPCGR